MDFSRKLSLLVIVICILISLKNQSFQCDPSSNANCCLSVSSAEKKFLEVPATESEHSSLRYDFYRESCPLAEQIIRSTVHDEYAKNPLMIPAILRMAFHDCFVKVVFYSYFNFVAMNLFSVVVSLSIQLFLLIICSFA